MLVEELMSHLESTILTSTRNMVRVKQALALRELTADHGSRPSALWGAYARASTMDVGVPNLVSHPSEIQLPGIARDFSAKLQSLAAPVAGDPTKVMIDKDEVSLAIANLATSILTREKENYLAYSRQYRAMEERFRRQLVAKESEADKFAHELVLEERSRQHQVQCELAERSKDLIAEITALRSKVALMRGEQDQQEHEIRERVKRDYDDLVHSLFSTSFALKNRFEEYRSTLHEDVVEGLYEVRKQSLQKLKHITILKPEDAEKKHDHGIKKADNLRDVQTENSMLSKLILKMRTMNDWKRSGTRSFYGKKIFRAREEAVQFKRALYETQIIAEEKQTQMSNEILALRRELSRQRTDIKQITADLVDEIDRRKALQQWKMQKSQLLSSLDDQARLWEKIKHLDIDKVRGSAA